MSARDVSKRGPTTSAGTPWRGETWACTACGETGPDRDDVKHSGCPAHPAHIDGAPHAIVFSPPEHAAAIAARRPG